MKKLRNMWKIWRKYDAIWRNLKKYVNILDLAIPYLYGSWDLEKFWAPPSYSHWDLEKFWILPLYMGLGIWKNSTPELPPELRDLEKFRSSFLHLALPLYRLWDLKKSWASSSFDYSLLARCHSFVFSI